jgi:phosphate-selective porin OprO/OprP
VLFGALVLFLGLPVPVAAQNTAAPTAPPSWTFEWGDHPSLQFGDVIEIDFRARFFGDVRGSGEPLDDSDTTQLDLARRRVGISGVVADLADFQVERELTDGEGWRDLYVNYRQFGRLELQAGQFKMPFGLDENTSSSNLDFVYRSRAATQLAPGRGRGVVAHGRIRTLRYEWGAFTADGDNVRGIGTDRLARNLVTGGRLIVQPFRSSRSEFEDFQAGIAYTTSDVSPAVIDLRGDTALGRSFFRSEFAVHGARRRIGVEARWRPGPFSVQSEFARLSNERLGQSIANTDLPPLVGSAWYVQGTWIATGERKTRGADRPRRPLLDGGIGSIELAARVEAVTFRSVQASGQPSTGPRAEAILPRSDRVVTLGVNWWPTRWIRVQANLLRDTLTNPPDAARPPSSSFWSHVIRFGVSL